MKHKLLCASILGITLCTGASAFAADGYVTGNVNLRAGPDIGYPSVDMLPAGTEVAIYGCVDGWSWCDVSTGDDRGWVAGSFLQEEYEGRRVYIADYGVRIGVPIVSFVFGTYWADHYRGRSWYGNRDRWSHIQPRYQPIAVHGGSREVSRSYSHPQIAPVRSPNLSRGSQLPAHAAPVNHQVRPAYSAPHNAAVHPAPQNAVQPRPVQTRPEQQQAPHPPQKQAQQNRSKDDHKDHEDN